MQFSRYLDLRAFKKGIGDLRIKHGMVSDRELERLERDRILIPRLRLRYPDPIERRWFAKSRRGLRPNGRLEANGPRWKAACELEKARQRADLFFRQGDPLNVLPALDNPKSRWKQFIQHPHRRRHVDWDDFRLLVNCTRGPKWHSDTVVTYYSTWQLLLYIECHDMGLALLGNTEGWRWTENDDLSGFQQQISFDPIRSLKSFRNFERQLDAVVWFSEEDSRNDNYVLRQDHRRRLIEEDERAEMERRSEILARHCRARFRVSYPQIIALAKFLAARWGQWHRIGHENHAKAYKTFLAKTIAFARYLRDVSRDRLIDDVGRVTGHFKPTLRIIYSDWATEWREDAERLLVSFARPDALFGASFSIEQANAFLDFVEDNDLYEFYWRWRSLNERAFSGDSKHLAGLKSDLQGMALSVEHIVDALLRTRGEVVPTQLIKKFSRIFPRSTAVGKLIANQNHDRRARDSKTLNLEWFEEEQDQSEARQIAADLVICHAIRGSAHSALVETNQLKLERLSLILLRGVMRAFVAARATTN